MLNVCKLPSSVALLVFDLASEFYFAIVLFCSLGESISKFLTSCLTDPSVFTPCYSVNLKSMR